VVKASVTATLSTLVELYEVEVEIRGNHQLKVLITRLKNNGFLKEERYLWGLDKWNRCRREKAIFLVLIKKDREKAFKTMLTQTENNSPLSIKVKKLTNFF